MQNFKTQNAKMKNSLVGRILATILLVTLLVQSLALPASALFANSWPLSGNSSSNGSIVNGIGGINSDEIIASLKKDFLNTVNEDLLMRIDEYELSGPVNIIITFTDKSLVDAYNQSALKDVMTFSEYSSTDEYYEEKARDEGYVRDDETVFIVGN